MHAPKYTLHTQKDLISFTRVMGGFFLLLTMLISYRADFTLTSTVQTLGGIGIGWLLWGVIHPGSTKPLYHAWMWLAFVMNFIMTRVILSLLFYGIALPTSLFLRITGKDLLGLREQKASYWKTRTTPTSHKHFEKLYTITGSEENS
jgi:hypothetical protein